MVSPNERVLIVGEGAVAQALNHVFNVLGLQCRHLEHQALSDTSQAGECRQLLGVAGGLGSDCPVVVSLWNPGVEPAEVVRFVHRLRTGFLWEGKLIVVVPNREDMRRVGRASLLGVADPGTLIESVKGHTLISWPLSLPEILGRVFEMKPLFTEEWWQIEARCVVRPICEDLERIRRELSVGDCQEARKSLEAVLDQLMDLEWWTFVRTHRCESEIRRLLKEYTDNGHIRDSRCLDVVDVLRLGLRLEM